MTISVCPHYQQLQKHYSYMRLTWQKWSVSNFVQFSNTWILYHTCTNFVIYQTLFQGIKRELGTAQFHVDSITPSHLLRMRSFLDFSSVEDLGFWCACLIAFYGLLRPGTIAITGPFETSKNVRRVDLMPCSWGYLLCLRHTKTIQFRERELNVILFQVNGEMCPASALQAYLHLLLGLFFSQEKVPFLPTAFSAKSYIPYLYKQELMTVTSRVILFDVVEPPG